MTPEIYIIGMLGSWAAMLFVIGVTHRRGQVGGTIGWAIFASGIAVLWPVALLSAICAAAAFMVVGVGYGLARLTAVVGRSMGL